MKRNKEKVTNRGGFDLEGHLCRCIEIQKYGGLDDAECGNAQVD
jgi:hypothetical protein